MENLGNEVHTKVGNPHPVPWMFIAGTEKYNRVLLVGNFRIYDIRGICNISDIVHKFDRETCQICNVDIKKKEKLGDEIKYDLMIINNLDYTASSKQDLELLREQHLSNDAQILLLETNPYYLRNFFKAPIKVISGVLADSRIKNYYTRFKFRNVSMYETMSNSGVPVEAFPPGHYYTNSNTFLLSEKFKHCFLNTRFSRFFFNSSLYVFKSGEDDSDLIEECIDAISKRPEFIWRSSVIRLVKVYLKYGKLILSFTSEKISKPEYLIVFPIDDDTRSRRENEKRVVDYLNINNSESKFFAKNIITGSINQMKYFAMEEFPGITVDINNSNLSEMTSSAYHALLSVARTVDTSQTEGNELKENIIANYLHILSERYPDVSDKFERVSRISNFARGLPLVDFFHGDLKLENFIVDSKTNQITKIIDMEHAEIPGPALLDLFYLISYNYESIHMERFDQIYQRLAENSISQYYRKLIQDYCSNYCLTDNQLRLSLVLFFVHHYAKRVFIHTDNQVELQEFLNCLEIASNILEQLKNSMHSV